MTIDHWEQILDMPCTSDGGTSRLEDVVASTHTSVEVTHIITRSTPSDGTCSPSRKVSEEPVHWPVVHPHPFIRV